MNTGGGHFVVGHGKSENNIYYMDPWFGEGLHISTYSWLRNDGNHTWTHTNKITTNPTASINTIKVNSVEIFPNPAKKQVQIKSIYPIKKIEMYTVLGQLVLTINNYDKVDVSNLLPGIYWIKIITNNFKTTQKLIVE